MYTNLTNDNYLWNKRISRRHFIKFCTTIATLLALPPTMIPRIVQALETAPRLPVLWLSFQNCTGCSESFLRAHTSSVEELIFNQISLDYHHNLQAAAGETAEQILATARETHLGEYVLIVEGALSLAHPGYATIAGESDVEIFQRFAQDAKAIVAVGTCASFGGIPQALPNPTGAVSLPELVANKPLINVPGCPPIPVVITSILVHLITFGVFPEMDTRKRPVSFYGETVHKKCSRRQFFNDGLFAENFGDNGAKQGWCLFKLGCKGTLTHNACATIKWNEGTSFPIESGHGCLGCAEPNFWDNGRFYRALTAATEPVSLPYLGEANAINATGQVLTTTTTFAGGIALTSEGETQFQPNLTLRLSRMVAIHGTIKVEPAHIGQAADLVVFAAYRPLFAPANLSPLYFLLDAKDNILPWNRENIVDLVPFRQTTLNAEQEVVMYEGQFIATGSLEVYFGYRLSEGTVVTNSKAITITITE